MNGKASRGRPAIPKDEFKDKVINFSFEIIKDKGVSALSIDEISRQAGVAKKTIYKHFINKDAIIEEMISEWTSTRSIMPPPYPAKKDAVLDSLIIFFKELCRKVLSQQSIAIFKFLQTDAELKKDYLETYKTNGIDNAMTVLNEWLKLVKDLGYINHLWPENSAGYLQSLIIAPLLRDIALGVLPPVPEYDPSLKIEKILNDFYPLITHPD